MNTTGNIREDYTFETFILGSNNRLAQAGALAVAESPGDIYNPLIIYGAPGLGKTHLMNCIGNYVLEHDSNNSVLYVSSEEFVKGVTEAARKDEDSAENLIQFREKFEGLDVFLIDDIQLLVGNYRALEEFFHVLGTLYEKKKQIVMTFDRHPREIGVFQDRLLPKYKDCLVVDIPYPDFETRKGILEKVTKSSNVDYDDRVLDYIVSNVKSNYAELEEAFKIALTILGKDSVDINLSKEALKDIRFPYAPSGISPRMIMDAVCDHFEVTAEDIKSCNRDERFLYPRQIIMYLCHSLTGETYKEIAQFLGGRDVATVMYGERVIMDLLEKDENIGNTVETIVKKIKSGLN